MPNLIIYYLGGAINILNRLLVYNILVVFVSATVKPIISSDNQCFTDALYCPAVGRLQEGSWFLLFISEQSAGYLSLMFSL